MCIEAPTAKACWRDALGVEKGLTYLGICGDDRHSVKQSSHNCAHTPGGNESALNGIDYPADYCHAIDIGHGGDRAKAKRLRDALLPDSRVRYVIDNAIGYYPEHRGGGTFASSEHVTHIHVSFMPGSTFDVRPYFGANMLPPIHWPLRPDDHNLGVLFLEIALVHSGFGEIVVDGSLGERVLDATHQMERFLKRRVRPAAVTRGDVEAITGWSKLGGTARPDYILTFGDQGPRVHELRTNLRKVGQNVEPTGQYDLDVQAAMTNVQRFFDTKEKAGNASQEDRQLVRALAQNA